LTKASSAKTLFFRDDIKQKQKKRLDRKNLKKQLTPKKVCRRIDPLILVGVFIAESEIAIMVV